MKAESFNPEYKTDSLSSEQKRESVKLVYDLIADQYSEEFGTDIEDLDVYDELERLLNPNSMVVDLGAGPGRAYAYFDQKDKGYGYVGLDFSEHMKQNAYDIHGEFPYIVDDIVNMKEYADDETVDAVLSMYTLFHIPKDNLGKLFSDVHDILKLDGYFLFSCQLGHGEEYIDEPYLGEEGDGLTYMNYLTRKEIQDLLDENGFEEIYSKDKIETLASAPNSNKAVTVYKIVQKIPRHS